MSELLTSPLLRRALLEVVVVGAIGGVVGVHIVWRRLSFATMALTHVTLPGVVIASLLGLNLVVGSAAFGLLVVGVIVLLGRQRALDDSTAIGVLLGGGFALGVLLISVQDGFTKDLSSFLVGSLVTVSTSDVWATFGVGLVIAALLTALHKELVAAAFDRDGAEAQGYPVVLLDALVLVAIQSALVVTVPAAGTILSVALLVGPAATARLWTDRVGTAMASAAAIGAGCGVVGLWASQEWDLAAGGAVAVTCGVVFFASLVATRVRPTGAVAVG